MSRIINTLFAIIGTLLVAGMLGAFAGAMAIAFPANMIAGIVVGSLAVVAVLTIGSMMTREVWQGNF